MVEYLDAARPRRLADQGPDFGLMGFRDLPVIVEIRHRARVVDERKALTVEPEGLAAAPTVMDPDFLQDIVALVLGAVAAAPRGDVVHRVDAVGEILEPRLDETGAGRRGCSKHHQIDLSDRVIPLNFNLTPRFAL